MVEKYQFTCSACGAHVVVDRHVREELLAQGCVVCSSSVRPHCFNPV